MAKEWGERINLTYIERKKTMEHHDGIKIIHFSVLKNNGDITERKRIVKISHGKTLQLIFVVPHLR